MPQTTAPQSALADLDTAFDAFSDLWSPEAAGDGDASAATELGAVLVRSGAVSEALVREARASVEKSPGRRLAGALVDLGADEPAVQAAVAERAGLTLERIEAHSLSHDADGWIDRLGPAFCLERGVLPLRQSGARAVVGVVCPDDLPVVDEVRHKLATPVKVVVVCRCDVQAVIEARRADVDAESEPAFEVDDLIADIDDDDIELVQQQEQDLDLEAAAGESPVIRFVNYLIFDAVKQGASDIHIEPQEKKLQVRFRIDGVMFDAMNPPAHMHAAVLSRLKIMANLDIAERRLPQDGRIRAMVHGRKLDLRMSTLPTATGEKAVLRILDTRSIQVSLDDLGMDEDTLLMWKRQITQPHGILLVTGPTGSGKTTTLYSSLNQMDRRKLNISTVEDPVEYHLGGINQTQAAERIGMTFGVALRALLRQDPDVIMVGEIRDADTARIAIQASLTGHLVLSTLHTNDAPGSVTRLINIGVEPYLIGSAVNAVLAQRLVRKVCDHCKEEVAPDEVVAQHLAMQGMAPDRVWLGRGCDKCRDTGYAGRVGLYEMLLLDDVLRDRIAANPSVTEFRRLCVERGMATLRTDGFRKVERGLTTVDEVLRVTEAVG